MRCGCWLAAGVALGPLLSRQKGTGRPVIAFQIYAEHLLYFYEFLVRKLLLDDRVDVVLLTWPHPQFPWRVQTKQFHGPIMSERFFRRGLVRQTVFETELPRPEPGRLERPLETSPSAHGWLSQEVAHPSGCSGELQLAVRLRAEARSSTLKRALQPGANNLRHARPLQP